MEIPFAGTLTESHFNQVIGHTLRPTYSRLMAIIGFLAVMGLVGPIALQMLRYDAPDLLGSAFPFTVACVFVFLMLLSTYRNAGKRVWRVQPLGVTSPMVGAIHDNGLLWNADVAKTEYKWKAFTNYVEIPDMVLLYQGQMFTLLPRTFFADDTAWNTAKSLISQNVDLKS